MTEPKNTWGPDETELAVLRRFASWTGSLTGNRTSALNEALAAVQAELPTFATEDQRTVVVEHKDGTSHSYKYITLGKVIEATAPIMAKHGLSFRTMPGYGDPGDGKIGMVLRYTLAHKSGDQIDGIFPISSGDKGIQGLGSAITYARRYCLAAILNIAVEQDDDGMAAMLNAEGEGGIRAQARGTTRARPARSNKPAERQATPSAAAALPGGDPVTGEGDQPTRGMINHMFGLLTKLDVPEDRDGRLGWLSDEIGRPLTTSKDMTKDEVQRVINQATDALAAMADQPREEVEQ
jgi:YD repeat-containing protein